MLGCDGTNHKHHFGFFRPEKVDKYFTPPRGETALARLFELESSFPEAEHITTLSPASFGEENKQCEAKHSLVCVRKNFGGRKAQTTPTIVVNNAAIDSDQGQGTADASSRRDFASEMQAWQRCVCGRIFEQERPP